MFDGNRLFAAHFSLFAHHHVMDRVQVFGEVTNCVQFAGVRIQMRMRAEGVLKRAFKRVMGHRLQFIGQLHRVATSFDHCPRLACVANHIGVDRVARGMTWARLGLFAQGGAHRFRTHPAVAIPQGLTVFEAQSMHHAVAHKPVIGRRVWGRGRVRADAQIAPV